MKILVVYTNTFRQFAPAPLGASLVAARLQRDGHAVRFLDLMFARSPVGEARRAAAEFMPDLVCYSLRNRDNQTPGDGFFDPLPVVRDVVGAVRAVAPAPVLLGGTAFTTFPRQWLDALGAEYGVQGDDLDAASRFVSSLDAGAPDLSVPGLVYRSAGEVRCNAFAIRGYQQVAFDGWHLLDVAAYRRSLSTLWDAAIVVRTGCPFQCVFCDYQTTFGTRWTLRPPEQVAEEALALQRRGARSVIFADAGFNRPLDHGKDVLAALIRRGVRLNFTLIFEPGEMDREFAEMFYRAGGRSAVVYAGSLSDAVLARARRPFSADDVVAGARTLRAAGVTSPLFLTFGGPGETPGTVEETLRRSVEVRAIRTFAGHGLRIQPGTELREIAVREGVIAPDDDCFNATFYYSPDTPRPMLEARLKRFDAERRLDNVRALPFLAGVLWNKFRP